MCDTWVPTSCEPSCWIVIFHPSSDHGLVDFLAWGRFKHVSAMAYVPEVRAWVTYDVGLFGTRITVVPRAESHLLGKWVKDCAMVVFPKRPDAYRAPPVLGWCVPSIRRLIGLKSGALRPDTLYRHCLREGGTVLDVACVFQGAAGAATARSDAGSATGGGCSVADASPANAS